MRHGKLVLALMLGSVMALAATAAWSDDAKKKGAAKPSTIRSDAFTSRQRPPALFDHDKHGEIVRCQACHHEFFVFENEEGGQGTECSECHKVDGTKAVPVTLREAFHGNCRGCHQRTLARGQKSGPVMCGQCHKELK